MLGGEDGRTLFLCAAPSHEERVVEVDRRGAILMTRVKTPRGGRHWGWACLLPEQALLG